MDIIKTILIVLGCTMGVIILVGVIVLAIIRLSIYVDYKKIDKRTQHFKSILPNTFDLVCQTRKIKGELQHQLYAQEKQSKLICDEIEQLREDIKCLPTDSDFYKTKISEINKLLQKNNDVQNELDKVSKKLSDICTNEYRLAFDLYHVYIYKYDIEHIYDINTKVG